MNEQRPAPLAGEIALVTGAASGIGRACLGALRARGAAVVGVDIAPEIEGLVDEEADLAIECDLTDEEAVTSAFERTVERLGPPSILVVNAGIFPASRPLAELSTHEWSRVLAVNLTASFVVMREAYPLLKQSERGGRIVVVGSKNVPAPGPGAGAYSASKAGLNQLARVAALEWAKDGIRINTVHPNAVFDTGLWNEELLAARARSYGLTVDQYRRNNLLQVEIGSRDVAELVAELCGPTFDRTTGAQIPIDGGNERVI